MQMNIKVSTSWDYFFLMEVAKLCPKYPEQKVANVFAKSDAATFVFYCDAKHSDILQGPAMFIVYCQPDQNFFCLNISV